MHPFMRSLLVLVLSSPKVFTCVINVKCVFAVACDVARECFGNCSALTSAENQFGTGVLKSKYAMTNRFAH